MSDIVDTLGRPMFGRKCTDSATTRDDLSDASKIIATMTAKLERANERIKRMEEAGDEMFNLLGFGVTLLDEKAVARKNWRDAKEPMV